MEASSDTFGLTYLGEREVSGEDEDLGGSGRNWEAVLPSKRSWYSTEPGRQAPREAPGIAHMLLWGSKKKIGNWM